jgi:hypothetical protein
MANGTTRGSTGTIVSKCLRTDFIDVAYIGQDDEAVEVDS